MEKMKVGGTGTTAPQRNRTILDWAILFVVVAIASVVILLSFSNTAKLAEELGLQPLLTAGLVELLFTSLLFIRGRQRATGRNVPIFLSVGYFTSLAFVTGVNMWGLAIENPTIGPVVGGAISAAMWLMESTLVWLWTDSHRPHEKSLRELKREAKREIKQVRLKQQIEWLKYEAREPDLGLIRQARKAEKRRKAAIKKGLPVFFVMADSIGHLSQSLEAVTVGHAGSDRLSDRPLSTDRPEMVAADQEGSRRITAGQAETASHDRPATATSSDSRPTTYRPQEPATAVGGSPDRPSAETESSQPVKATAGRPIEAAAGRKAVDQVRRPIAAEDEEVADTEERSTTKANTTNQSAASTSKDTGQEVTASKKKTNRKSATVTAIRPVTDEEVYRVAVQYYLENGREPGQRELARLAGCSRHRADKAKKRLKQRIEAEAI